MPENTSVTKLIKNALYNSGGWGVNLVVTFLATPYFVKKLGVEGYGVYTLLMGLVGYFQLLDPGLAKGVTKFVSKFKAGGKELSIHKSINSALFFQVLLGVPGTVSLVLLADPILNLLNIPGNLYHEARVGLYVAAIGFLIQVLSGTFGAILKGLQRYDAANKIDASMMVLFYIGGIFILNQDYGLIEVVVWKVITVILTFGWLFQKANMEIGGLNFACGFSKKDIKDLFDFSGYLYISQISGFVTNYILRFAISAYLGPAEVTLYEVPRKLVKSLGGFLSRATSVLFPFISELFERKEVDKVRKYFINGSKLFASISIPLYLFISIYSKNILNIWMGDEFAEQSWIILSALSISVLFGSLTTAPHSIALGMGLTKEKSLYSVISLILYAVSIPLLIPKLGVIGVVLVGFISGVMPGWAFIFIVLLDILDLSKLEFLRRVFSFHAIPLLISVFCLILIRQLDSSLLIILSALIFIGSYFSIMFFSKWIPLSKIRDLGMFR